MEVVWFCPDFCELALVPANPYFGVCAGNYLATCVHPDQVILRVVSSDMRC